MILRPIRTITTFSIFIFLSLSLCEGEKILFYFRFTTYSHRIIAWPLVEALVDKGHSVTFLQSNENKNPHPKVEEIPVKPLLIPDFLQIRSDLGPSLALYNMVYNIPWMAAKVCNDLLDDPEVTNWINSASYDVVDVVIDTFYNDCAYGLAYKWNAKTVIFSTATVFESWPDVFGFPAESNCIPNNQFGLADLPLNFFNRVLTTLGHLYYRYSLVKIYHPLVEDNLRKKLNIPDMPSLVQLESNVSLVLLNTHYSEEVVRSLPPLIVSVGGMHCKEKAKLKQLPEKMEKFINGSSNGFIYVSFGSGAKISSADKKIQDVFFNAIRNAKTRFLWKWEGIRAEDMPENVYTAEWMPQQSILAHPKIRAFITHGGLLSMQEAIFNGVPMISFPIFADQDYNAERLHRMKRGIRLEITTVTQDELEDALDKILNDETYKKNIQKTSEIFKDRPNKPIETALWWMEYVFRHNDTSHLRPLAISQTWYERRLLDVWSFLFLIVFLIVFFITHIFKRFYLFLFVRLVKSNGRSKTKITSNGKHYSKSKTQ